MQNKHLLKDGFEDKLFKPRCRKYTVNVFQLRSVILMHLQTGPKILRIYFRIQKS